MGKLKDVRLITLADESQGVEFNHKYELIISFHDDLNHAIRISVEDTEEDVARLLYELAHHINLHIENN